MSLDPFLGEIRIVAFNFAPRGWALCDGQLLSINQNQALFALLGTTYGGDGRTHFALPDFRGRAPMHVSAEFSQGLKIGAETHTLSVAEMPQHSHMLSGVQAAATVPKPDKALLAQAPVNVYASSGAGGNTAMNAQSVSNTGGNLPHNNMQPFLVMNYIIALQGLFPSRS